MKNFKKIDIEPIETKPIQLISKTWMLITAGKKNDFNSMTASWGGIGYLWKRPVAFIFIRPQRYTLQFVEKEQFLTLSFFDERYRKALNIMGSKSGKDTDKIKESDLTPISTPYGSVAYAEAHYIMECKKLYEEYLRPEHFTEKNIVPEIYHLNDFHKMLIVEISQAWENTETVSLFK